MTYAIPPILDFIKNFKRHHDESALIDIFTNGNCYHFALILNNLYPGGTIIYSVLLGHFAYFYEGKYYDITGIINISDPLKFPDEIDPLEYYRLLRDCVYKEDYYPYGKFNG